MSSTADRSRHHAHPVHLRLDAEQLAGLRALADAKGLTLTAVLRLAVAEAVDGDRGRPGDPIAERMLGQLRSLTHVAMAGLIASEHTRLVVEKFLGRHNLEMLEGLEVAAATAARERLIELEVAEGES